MTYTLFNVMHDAETSETPSYLSHQLPPPTSAYIEKPHHSRILGPRRGEPNIGLANEDGSGDNARIPVNFINGVVESFRSRPRLGDLTISVFTAGSRPNSTVMGTSNPESPILTQQGPFAGVRSHSSNLTLVTPLLLGSCISETLHYLVRDQ